MFDKIFDKNKLFYIKMYSKLALLLCLLSLSSCRFIYIRDMEQGNILNDEKARSIQHGMSKANVIEILGNPTLNPIIQDKDKVIYVYSIKGKNKSLFKQLIITIKNDKVVEAKYSENETEKSGK